MFSQECVNNPVHREGVVQAQAWGGLPRGGSRPRPGGGGVVPRPRSRGEGVYPSMH